MGRSVAVVIPVRNDARDLPVAVASVLAQTTTHLHEVLLSVGPSTDDSMDIANALASTSSIVRVIENPSGRTPEAMNLGIAATKGDVVVRVDSRSVLPVDYIENALESMTKTGAANVGAVQVPVGDSPTQKAIAAAMRSRAGSGGAAYRHATAVTQVDTAYLGVFRRDALEAVGGYDVAFQRNQDGELNARLNAAGHQVWLDPRLRVSYRPRASLRTLGSQYWQYGWWRLRTMRKNSGSVALRQIAAPLLVIALACSLVAVAAGFLWAVAVPLLYLAAVTTVAALSSGLSIRERVTMMAALITMHLSWGTSFLVSAVVSLLPGSVARKS